MPSIDEFKLLKTSKRNKITPDLDQELKIGLNQDFQQQVEYDRTKDLNLSDLYQNERQKSTVFRPLNKITFLFDNVYTGNCIYTPYRNNLFYTDAIQDAITNQSNPNNPWKGYPQYSEFQFIRTDNNVNGYTQGAGAQIQFVNKSANTYNWSYYLTYAEQNADRTLFCDDPTTGLQFTWQAFDGIPFLIETNSLYGNNVISFRCPMNHGLQVGEYVQLSINYNGESLFQVQSLGNQNSGSEEFIFNVSNIGYTGTTFSNNTIGTFKRVINTSDIAGTQSRYYVRIHKVLAQVEDSVFVNAGFEKNVFGKKVRYEKAALTPNNQDRASVKQGNDVYTLSYNVDIDLSGLRDNLFRPVTQLFTTFAWKGYLGWTLSNISELKDGYRFNLPLINNQPSAWWDTTNTLSNSSLTKNSYTVNAQQFYYVNSLNVGDQITGDFCEFNPITQIERVVSENYHKFTYNFSYFYGTSFGSLFNQLGYYYQVHHPMTIRVFSTSLSEEPYTNIASVPDYSHYSDFTSSFVWRDIYDYGYIDSEGFGVDYPFLNGKHYPKNEIIFRLIADGSQINYPDVIADPITDECE
jgi:hypothetical protein